MGEALADLAAYRGLTVEELRKRLREAGHHTTARTLLKGPRAGYGHHIEEVLGGMSVQEKALLVGSFMATFLKR